MPRCAVLVLALAVAACGDTTEPDLQLDAGVRVVHAAPETARLEVLLEDELRAVLEYAEVSDRFTLAAGERHVELRLAGSTAALIDLRSQLEEGGRYTILAAGRENSLQPIVLTDDPTPADTGFTRIRFVHAAPTAGAVDVYISEPGDEIGTAIVTFAGMDFGADSDYIQLDSRTYRVRVTSAGGVDLVVDLPLLVLSSNRVVTIVLMDTEGSGPPHGIVTLSDRDARQ